MSRVPISSPNPINAILPGQIPTNETPEITESNDSKPSISTSKEVPTAEPNHSTNAWPLNQSSMQAVPPGKIFIYYH